MVGLATCWLHPQAIHGLLPLNEAGLKVIKWGCLQVKGRAGYRKGKRGLCEPGRLAYHRQDLWCRLEARYGLRERDRWKVLD